MSINEPPKPHRLFIFSHPRTASNLLCKLFSEHPAMRSELYYFLFARQFGPESQSQMTGKKVDELREDYEKMWKDLTYQGALDKLEKHIASSEAEGKIPLLKDHCWIITRTEEAQKMLTLPQSLPPQPLIEDRMLDIPEENRSDIIKNPYVDLNARPVNPTYLPDRLLKTFAPVFIIRHPAKQVESWYRVTRAYEMHPNENDFELAASFKPSRRLFEYYVELYRSGAKIHQTGNSAADAPTRLEKWPIVIDGDDLINDAEGLTAKVCETIGIEHSGVIYKWDQTEIVLEGKAAPALEEAFYRTLWKSGGVKKNPNPNVPSISESSTKWAREWGDTVAKALVQYAEAAVADYNYLRQFRLY